MAVFGGWVQVFGFYGRANADSRGVTVGAAGAAVFLWVRRPGVVFPAIGCARRFDWVRLRLFVFYQLLPLCVAFGFA